MARGNTPRHTVRLAEGGGGSPWLNLNGWNRDPGRDEGGVVFTVTGMVVGRRPGPRGVGAANSNS
eukprot:767075-Hanusia_phi.AAC.4